MPKSVLLSAQKDFWERRGGFTVGDYQDGYDEEMDDEESEEFDFDCGAMHGPKGEPMGCSKAGSEECDWECPYAHAVERSLRAQYAANVRWAKQKAGAGEGRKS